MSRAKTAPGKAFRDGMNRELERVAAIVGSDLAWSPGELGILGTIEADLDRRAALEAALAECDDIGSSRALKLSSEIRLLGAQISRLTRTIQAQLRGHLLRPTVIR
jgi:hypothetical protein